MYKTKTSGIVPRPNRIDNTFIGTNTDISQYGYYEVVNDPGTPPEGQRYVDTGNGTYDEDAMTYTADWVLEDIPIPPPVFVPMTHLQFMRRFTFTERAQFETLLADARNGTSTLPAEVRGQLLVMGRAFESAQEVSLDDSETIQFVGALVDLGILTQTRADEILTP